MERTTLRSEVSAFICVHLRLICLKALAAAIFFAHPGAAAQDFPNRPMRMITPSPPGGSVDLLSRTVSQYLAKIYGVPVIVDNRAGASAVIGSELLAKSAPDGYTLMLGYSSHATNPIFIKKLPYDTLKDFAGVVHVGDIPLLLVVHPAVPAASVRDLIALAKARPGQLQFAAGAVGGGPSMAGLLFGQLAGIDIAQIQYKGNAPALTDLLGGQVTMMFDTINTSIALAKAGRLRPLAVTSARRSSLAPDLPTMIEAGLAGFDVRAWFAVMAPARTPRDIVRKLNADINKALTDPAIRSRLTSDGVELAGGTPEEIDAFIRAEMLRWPKIIKTGS
jgi:tripartite-type tricarboxylate transporter receptor subunit TctC